MNLITHAFEIVMVVPREVNIVCKDTVGTRKELGRSLKSKPDRSYLLLNGSGMNYRYL